MIVKCLKCKKDFKTFLCYIKNGGGKFCSNYCANSRRTKSKEFIICQQCHRVFKNKFYHKLAKFCSKKCSSSHQNTKIKKNCLICNKKFLTFQQNLAKGNGKFCSHRCFGIFSSKTYTGDNHHNWKGGITPINNKIRGSLEYKLWSDSVWNRDGNYCQKCGENRVSKLVAHHIFNFSQWPELRMAIDNGITFCRKCHNWFHRIYRKQNNTKEQILKFLKEQLSNIKS